MKLFFAIKVNVGTQTFNVDYTLNTWRLFLLLAILKSTLSNFSNALIASSHYDFVFPS